jgi:hypothetical protein
MHVVGKHHPGVDMKWRPTLRLANCVAEHLYMLYEQLASTVI